jgi:regulator of protease activity HflC (stomatin/prohibitin superfamily)
MHHERTNDLQEVTVQVTVMYRFARPILAARRLNFSINLYNGAWLDNPLDRATSFWQARTQGQIRGFLSGVTLAEAVRNGADRIAALIRGSLDTDAEIESMGMAVVGVQVVSVISTSELEKALQTPTREAIQQKADEAIFARRALAVEKERAIRENELSTELELAKRQESLIEQYGANRMREVKRKAESEQTEAEARAQREGLLASAEANQTRARAEGNAAATRLMAETTAEGDRLRVEAWDKASARTLMGLALQELARNIKQIGHLNITPNLLGEACQKMLSEEVN